MRDTPKPVSPEAITLEIGRLSSLSLKDLKAAWAAEFCREPPKGLWRDILFRTLAWCLQEKAFGGHDKATLKLLDSYGRKGTRDLRTQRLMRGTVLVREFEGKGVVSGGAGAVRPEGAEAAALAAIGRAKRWVDELMAGGSLAHIAKQESKGERQIRLLIPLAFLSPGIVRGLVDGTLAPATVTHMAKNVAPRW